MADKKPSDEVQKLSSKLAREYEEGTEESQQAARDQLTAQIREENKGK